MSNSKQFPAIGIDLGTTHCCVAHINDDGRVDVIGNSQGIRTTPSYVFLTNEEPLIGEIARDELHRHPKNVIYDSKRLIGRGFNDENIQGDIEHWTFKVLDHDNEPVIEVPLKDRCIIYKPHEISAMLLKYMKEIAEVYIGEPVKNAIITVPAHFNYHQRTATIEAGKIAGLNVLQIINEPTAAALAYIHKNKNKIKDQKNILVFDLGGGTLDVSIVEVEANSVTVTATAGNTHLGGRDFDNNLRDLICQRIIDDYGESALKSDITNRRIRQAVEKLKTTLSLKTTAHIELSSLGNKEDVEIEITRKEFEEINAELFISALAVVTHCISDANLRKKQIDDIVLVGGSTRIPKIQEMLMDFFEGKTLSKAINPEEAIAYGAALQTAKFTLNNKIEVPTKTDVTSLSLGVEIQGGVMDVLIPRNCTIPISADGTYYSTTDKQTERSWSIYEGERPLVKDNIYLGKCTLKLPPRPPGYPVQLIFRVEEDGILRINARDETGLHKDLTIVYEKHDAQKVNDRIQDAKSNKVEDQKRKEVTEKWRTLKNYCTRLKAICDYDKGCMPEEGKEIILKIVKEIAAWLENNRELTGSEEENRAIHEKDEKIQDRCEPIAKRYGYEVRNISWAEFYRMITNNKNKKYFK